MCIIAVKFKNRDIPSLDTLKNCERNNPNGIGIALRRKGKEEILIKKDFKSAKKLYNWLKSNVRKEDTLLIHFRIATSGKVDKGNRHPFPITQNKRLLRAREVICRKAVVHNGILSGYSGHKKFSDTQKFVIDILSRDVIKNNLRNPIIQKLIKNYIDGDKLAILTEKGDPILIGKFEKEKGILYSNTTYKDSFLLADYYTGYGRYYSEDEEDIKAKCDCCGKYQEVNYITIDRDVYKACSDCESELIKGKLKNDYKECEFCGNYFLSEELSSYKGSKFCKNCKKELAEEGYNY